MTWSLVGLWGWSGGMACQGGAGCAGIQGWPVSASRNTVVLSRPCLVAVLRREVAVASVESERGITVDHVTIYRWVQRCMPLLVDAAWPCRHCTVRVWGAAPAAAVVEADSAGSSRWPPGRGRCRAGGGSPPEQRPGRSGSWVPRCATARTTARLWTVA